jgi:hypothetical protein
MDLFTFSGERRETPALLGLLERANLNHNLPKGPKNVGASFLSPEDGNRSNF